MKRCDESLKLVPNQLKVLMRRAQAQEQREKYVEAYADFECVRAALSGSEDPTWAQLSQLSREGSAKTAKALQQLHGANWRTTLAARLEAARPPPVDALADIVLREQTSASASTKPVGPQGSGSSLPSHPNPQQQKQQHAGVADNSHQVHARAAQTTASSIPNDIKAATCTSMKTIGNEHFKKVRFKIRPWTILYILQYNTIM